MHLIANRGIVAHRRSFRENEPNVAWLHISAKRHSASGRRARNAGGKTNPMRPRFTIGSGRSRSKRRALAVEAQVDQDVVVEVDDSVAVEVAVGPAGAAVVEAG